ncbi:hypothetical protein [Roseospirillum parvum]|uniref:LPS-assembly lipoprotein n=1 Tax=Roseospirillum parvum TaxID=83401 RepID=A0A1G8DTI4_9PROT|nr:hypothetical protein [Roseospirillum parvum]SDH60881.1 hypothetical protein SAMN05421742_108113 [Roseospirillum parvum]
MLHPRTALKIACLGLALLLPGACGYQPLLANRGAHAPVPGGLAQLSIAPIEEREGQLLHGHLERLLLPPPSARQSVGRFRLEITQLTDTITRTVTDPDGTYSLNEMTVGASMNLNDQGATLFSDRVEVRVNYSVVDDQYAVVTSRENALERALNELANLIAVRTASALSRHLSSS